MNELAAETSHHSTRSKWCSVAAMEGRAGERGGRKRTEQQSPCSGLLANPPPWANARSAQLDVVALLHVMGSPSHVLVSSQYQCEQLFPTPETQSPMAAWFFQSQTLEIKKCREKNIPFSTMNQREDSLLSQAVASAGANCWTQLKVQIDPTAHYSSLKDTDEKIRCCLTARQ